MNIALVGYGKMGKAIEQIALQRGHSIVLKITSQNANELTEANLQKADVVIEFTNPESAFENVKTCLKAQVPTVCGSTGWSRLLPKAEQECIANNTAFLWASNFSIGVNIFFEINKKLAALMNDWKDYDVKVEETHHTQKKDAPSGTAITIAEQIIDNCRRKKHWKLEEETPITDETILPIQAYREDNIPGTHVVTYASAIDDIEIKHTAHSRDGFALGAVLAAEFLKKKKGVFSMSDVLNS